VIKNTNLIRKILSRTIADPSSFQLFVNLSQPMTARFSTLLVLVLTGTHSVISGWVFLGSTRPVAAQTAPLPTLTPHSPRPTSLELVEQARQRLQQRGELPNGTPAVVPTLTMPTAQDRSFNLYRLGPGDTISVVVQRFPDLTFQATIDQEGQITPPLLGKISLQGLTIAEAQERVRQSANRIVIDPVVLLALTNPRPVLVTLTGEIARPGVYALQLPRVASAILTAGGATSMADLRSLQIKRPLKDGSVLEETIDLITPLKDGSTLPDLRLQEGDVIVIPKMTNVQDDDRSLMARSTLVKPQITVRLLSYSSGGLGNVTLPNGSTFLDALTAARPNPDNANLRRVALIRFDPVQKKAVTYEIDARAILKGDMSRNMALEDNDVIVVGRNLVGKITHSLNTFTQPFRDVLGFLLFFRQLRQSADDLFGPTGRD
jgi:polysaccharide export outer membrane protein